MESISLISIEQLTFFKAYDARSELSVNFDEGITYRIKRADAQHFRVGKIVVVQGAWEIAPQLAAAVASGITDANEDF